MDHHHFRGRNIPHIKLDPKMKIEDLIEVYAGSGYNGRKLGEAAKVYSKMIQQDATICLTVAGAMTPVGFGGIIKSLIERGFVDWIITTGANVYHEDHFAWGLPIKQGHFDVDDQIVQKMFKTNLVNESFTSAKLCNIMGKISKEKSKHPERSFIVSAYDYDVPVYIGTLSDSSVALNMAYHRLHNQIYYHDFTKEILEQAAILYNSKKSGILELGGGVPKNTAQQTGPLLDQILRRNDGGQDYIIQITDARPDTGGLSGATLQEGKSWGKVQDAHHDMITVYADATITFPILALYVLSNQKPRKPKRLYKKLGKYYEKLQSDYLKTPGTNRKQKKKKN